MNTSLPSEDVLRHRPRLLGLAYRALGELALAEDVVQEAYLRWHETDQAAIANPEAWFVTVVSRLAVDRLRRAATERAAYDGPWLPEPVLSASAAPDQAVQRTSDLSFALLVLLQTLGPEERVAFLLREVFGEDYAEIARVLERREPAVRQMIHRARERVQSGRPRFAAPVDAKEQILHRFVQAISAGDQAALLALVAPDVTITSDGGGKAYAARRIVHGADRVVRLLVGVQQKIGHLLEARLASLNGEPAALAFQNGALYGTTQLELDDAGRIRAIYRVLNPDKLGRVQRAVPLE